MSVKRLYILYGWLQRRQVHSVSSDWKGKKMGGIMRNILSSALVGINAANYQVVKSHYQFHLWDKMAIFAKVLSNEQRKLANALITGDQIVTKYSLRASLESSNSVARVIMSAIMLCRHVWL